MTRKRTIAGNWKMNLDFQAALKLATAVSKVDNLGDKEVILFPPYIYLSEVFGLLANCSSVYVGAQNCHHEDSGAYTGEVSASMLKSLNIPFVLIGHSERRMYSHEDNDQLFKKLQVAIKHDLKIVFCCGEPLNERKAKTHQSFVAQQLENALFKLNSLEIQSCMIAYEPIWAIGTGETASAEQAQEMHHFIRSLVKKRYSVEIADQIKILYGGSVKPDNAESIFSKPDVDGGLIGGASLSAESFIGIIQAD